MSAVSGVPREINQEAAHVLLISFCNLEGKLCTWREFGVDGHLTFVPRERLAERGGGAECDRLEEVCC